MSAQILQIDARMWSDTPSPLSRLSAFAYHEDEHIPAGTVLENPNISLYCFDDENRRAIFVATPLDANVAKASFISAAQYEYAQYLVSLPYNELFQLTDTMESLDHLIQIYSVGRSGSTLLCKAFGEVEDIASFSEPGALSNLLFLRELDGSRDQEITRLIGSCIQMDCKLQRAKTYVVKWPSWNIHFADLIQTAFPYTRNIFLYRDAELWANSWHRIYTKAHIDFDAIADSSVFGSEDEIARMIPLFLELTEGFGKAKTIDMLGTLWLSPMDEYLKLYQQGIPFLAIRYEDLNSLREKTLQALFDYSGVPISAVDAALKAFEKDAQEGTLLEGTSQQEGAIQFSLSAEQVARLRAILQKHDTIKTPDFTLPGTFLPA